LSAGRDRVSAHHPAGAEVADVLLTAAGVLHATPKLAVMPDDPLLGKFQKDFAGKLGMIEPYPNVPDSSAGFAGAVEIIAVTACTRSTNPRTGGARPISRRASSTCW
jgi:hypothetical protein